MNRKTYFVFAILVIISFGLGSCASPKTDTISLTTTLTATATTTASPAAFSSPAITETPSPKPGETFAMTLPVSTPMFLGTSIPAESEAINSNDIQRLTYMAQWGRGTILGTAFTPDGAKFVVGSAFGLAVYNIQELQSEPIWVPFEKPTDYETMSLSEDGKYLRLMKDEEADEILDFQTGHAINNPPSLNWINTTTQTANWGEMELASPDGTKQLRSYAVHDEDFWDIEYSIREVYDTNSGGLLYKLPDETFYVRYNDVHQPEGCDLNSTSMCGNAFSPNAFHPYKAAFSPSGDTLTILYRAPNYGNTNRFSVLRTYDAENGKLLNMVGGFKKPVQTFVYNPDNTRLAVAFVDGSIQLWNLQRNESTSGAWHFNDYLTYTEFTSDGRYLLLRRPDALEVRSTIDGALRSRLDAVAYTLSPIDSNIIAIADGNNVIKIMELDSGKVIQRISAHEYQIFTIAFSPDGKYIASSGQDCKVKLWDAQTGEFIHYFEDTRANGYEGGPPLDETDGPNGNSRIFIYYINFIKGTDQIVGFGSWGTMVSWNINSGATNYVVYSAPLEFYNGMMTVSPHYPDSFNVDTTGQRFHIGNTIYNLQTGEALGEYQLPADIPEDCASGGPRSTDGKLLFTLGYGGRDGQVCILDANDNHLIQLIDVIPDPEYGFTLAGLSLSQDGKTLIIATTMGTVNVYRIAQ